MIDEKRLRAMIVEVVREELARAAPKAETGEFLTTTGAAKVAGVTTKTIRRWIDGGKLPVTWVGARMHVRRADLDVLMSGERRERELSPEELADRMLAR